MGRFHSDPSFMGSILQTEDRGGRRQIVFCCGEYIGKRTDFGVYDARDDIWNIVCGGKQSHGEKKRENLSFRAHFFQRTLQNRRAVLKKRMFAVCDREEQYVERLAQHLKRKQSIPFEIFSFTDLEVFWEFEKTHEIDFLLIETGVVDAERLKNFKGCVALLSGGEIVSKLLRYPALCKYQPWDQIYKEMMEIYYKYESESGTIQNRGHQLKSKTTLLGVYSPVRRCGKTQFALTLGQILAEKSPVLYLNLDPISVFHTEKEEESDVDISDLVYLFRQDKNNFLYRLGGCTRKIRRLDYIVPGIGWDLGKVQTEEWIQMIEEIFRCSVYETIVIDFDESIGDLPGMLECCETVYMPVLEDEIAREKIIQYEKMIQKTKGTELLKKTKKVALPFVSEQDPEKLSFGKMGYTVRELLGAER